MSVPIESKSAPIKKLQMIGVDVAKHKLDVSIDNNTVLTIDNNEESFKKLAIKKHPYRDEANDWEGVCIPPQSAPKKVTSLRLLRALLSA
jgi:hypothetical protein